MKLKLSKFVFYVHFVIVYKKTFFFIKTGRKITHANKLVEQIFRLFLLLGDNVDF